MSEERAKILKMVKEGRITVEEAELLLDALNEGEESGEGTRSEGPGEASGGRGHWRHGHDWARGGHRPGPGWSSFDFDFSPIQSSFQEAFKGFEQSLREAAKNFPKMDFEGHLGRIFGKARAEAVKESRVSSSGLRGLTLSNSWGNATVTAAETSEVVVHARVSAWGPDRAAAQEFADGVEIAASREGDALVIKHAPGPRWARSRYKVDFEISVPRAMEVDLKSMSGDLSVAGTEGNARLWSLSGDLTAKGVAGDLVADSKSGDLEIEGCSGALRAAAVSGGITVLSHRASTVSCHSVSGDVRVELRPEERSSVNLKSVSGDLRLKLPADASFKLAAETGSGDIDCGLPLEYAERGDRRVRGVLNGASGTVELSTRSGNIAVKPL